MAFNLSQFSDILKHQNDERQLSIEFYAQELEKANIVKPNEAKLEKLYDLIHVYTIYLDPYRITSRTNEDVLKRRVEGLKCMAKKLANIVDKLDEADL